MPAFSDRPSAAAHLASVSASCAARKAVVAPVESCVYSVLLASLRAGKGAPCLVRSVERGCVRLNESNECIFEIFSSGEIGDSSSRIRPAGQHEIAYLTTRAYSKYEKGNHRRQAQDDI